MSEPEIRNEESPRHYNSQCLGNEFQRLASYRQQLRYAAADGNQKILVVGKGDGFTVNILREMGKAVTVLDINAKLSPDVVGSVDDLPIEDNSFDACLCCQVLEHLPFERFHFALSELRRVSRRTLILSLPDVRRFCQLAFRFARYKAEFQFSLDRLHPKIVPATHLEQHGHFWEIGYKSYGIRRVRESITSSGWDIEEVRRVPDLSWHTFFLLRKSTTPPARAL